ncbi:polysaccharide biosynthesis C-terminal domain-containing protein [Streptosporangium subroseum]|uniref:oligosaccharide flippase family protein n=1 Tax=Streptosporangium subroseum TaxID=106412 RepID=UPI00341EDB01
MAVGSVASQVIRVILAAVTGVLIARTLQPEGRGVYAVIATTAATAIAVGHLSMEKTQIALWANSSRHRLLTTNGLILGLILGSVSALVTLAVIAGSGASVTLSLLALALLAAPFGVAAINLQGILLLQSRMGTVNRFGVVSALTQCLPLLFLVVTGHVTVTGVIVCWAASTVVPFVLSIRALWPISLRWEGGLLRRQLGMASKYHIGLVAYHLLLTVDVLLLNALHSAAEVGIYTVAVTVLSLMRIPAEAITQLALPRQATGDTRDAEQVTARTLRLNLLLSSAFIGVLAAVSPWLVPLVYGLSFAGSVAPLLGLAPGMIALTLVRPAEQYLVRLGQPIGMVSIAVAALSANVLLNLLMIPRWGAVGAALASTAAYILMTSLELTWFARSAGIPVSALLPRTAEIRSVLGPLKHSGAITRLRRRAPRKSG